MIAPSSLVVAIAMMSLFWVSFDSGWFGERAPAGITAALGIFTVIFALGAWATNATGDVKRSRMFSGVALATGLYAAGRLLAG